MYCDFYHMRERPFNVTADPKFLYLNARYCEALASLHNLRRITLDYTTVNDAGLAVLHSLPGLQEISLDATDVSDKSVETLKAMGGLKSLNLYHTLVTEKGMHELAAALPACKIIFDRDSALPNRRTRGEN